MFNILSIEKKQKINFIVKYQSVQNPKLLEEVKHVFVVMK